MNAQRQSTHSSVVSCRGTIPAWMLSVAFHGLVLLLIGFVWVAPSRRAAPPRQRSVGIVLADTRLLEDVAYLSESRATDSAEVEVSQRTSEQQAYDSHDPSSSTALPAAVEIQSLLSRELQLPGTDTFPMKVDTELIHGFRVQRSGRRSIAPGQGDAEILAEDAAARAAAAARGPATEVSIFGSAAARGWSFAFLIDRSDSMGGDGLNALAAARDELHRALKHLTPKHQFQVIAYHHKCVYLNVPRLVPATPNNLDAVPEFIDNLASFGGTGHEMAIRAGLALEPDALFLLTDGGDPPLNPIQLANIRKLARGRTTIHCIQFGFGPLTFDRGFMQELARQNGGGFTYVDMR